MAEKYHISPTTGNPNRCYANTKPCPLGGEKEHYPTKEAARAAYEKKQAPSLTGLKKTKTATPAPVKTTSSTKAKSAKVTSPGDDEEFYSFKEESLDDVDFDPNNADDWDDDPFKEEKDEWGDDDDVWDSSKMSADEYEERTSNYRYSWDR